MIQNKHIVITKENYFDKGWALFEPFDFSVCKDRTFEKISVLEIVKLITFSKAIYLVLKKPCLSSKIIEEIMWANKYIEVHITASNQETINYYSSIAFNSSKVNSSIDFNYIGIEGKENKYYIINDEFFETDNTICDFFFKNSKSINSFDFLKDTQRAILVDTEFNNEYKDILQVIKNNNIPFNYVINANYFDKNALKKARKLNIDLFLSDFTSNTIVLQKNNGEIYAVSVLNNGLLFSYRIGDIKSFFGNIYKSMNMQDNCETKSLSGEVYECSLKRISKLSISNLKTIEIEQNISDMEDFVNETFDSSIVEKHNDYAAIACAVEYKFTLIPPLLDKTYKESSIYDDAHKLLKELSMHSLDVQCIENSYRDFINEDCGLISFLRFGVDLTNRVKTFVDECNYKEFYVIVNEAFNKFTNMKESLLKVFSKMFCSINEVSSNNKFDKFDDEIVGYEQIINEKNAQICKGIDVLSNKRRVEILSKKIADLIRMKDQFEKSASSRLNSEMSNYINFCKAVINGSEKSPDVNNDSISNIIRPKEESKTAKLDSFTKKYLLLIKNYIESNLQILEKLRAIKIPTDYKVYDKNSSRFIAIDDLSEFISTKTVRQEFNLNCVARR